MDSNNRVRDDKVLSIVIPCYNEQEVLPALFERLEKVANQLRMDYEIIFVDDGSHDNTWSLLCEQYRKNAKWKCIKLARNFGHQLALWTGLKASRGHIVAMIDADLQDPPELIDQFIQKWEDNYDVVYAVRKKRKEGLFKKIAYFCYYRILRNLADSDIPLDSGDFCLIDRSALNSILKTGERSPFIRGLRAWVGYRQYALPYERDARAAGEVKYTLRKLIALAFNGIISFSIKPLRISTYLGLLISVFAFIGVIFTLAQRIFADYFDTIGLRPIPGFATIVISILFLGGVQLLCIGILGEYVGRIYENIKGRPLTTILSEFGFESNNKTP